jgi:hypothetical protein
MFATAQTMPALLQEMDVKAFSSVHSSPIFAFQLLARFSMREYGRDSRTGPYAREVASAERAERNLNATTSPRLSGALTLGFVRAAFGSVQLIKLQSGVPSRFGSSLKFDIANRRRSEANNLPNLRKRHAFAA